MMASEETCPLPYPKRFEAAHDFVTNPHPKAKTIPDDLRLLLFALHKQASEGPCREAKPWSWNVVETAKWESWHRLGSMTKMDAMRHYVGQLEKNQPDWWTILAADAGQNEKPVVDGTSQLTEQTESGQEEKVKDFYQKLEEATAAGSWSTPYLGNALKPTARYEHEVVLVDKCMYLIGGNCSGKYLNDMWCFDFATFTWSQHVSTDQNEEPLPSIAGHTLTKWKNSILIIGGHVKTKDLKAKMTIRSIDLTTFAWSDVETTGEAPVSRGGHTATLVGQKVYVFGGEDVARRPLGDLYVLDLGTLVWESVPMGKDPKSPTPTARSAHVAISYHDRYILYFGGGSVASCFDDLIVFDTQGHKWCTPMLTGRKPSPRAGHSAAVLNNHWYIVGGGNNSAGCTDMAYLDLAQLNQWPPSRQDDDDDEDKEEELKLDSVEYQLSWTIVGTIPERSYLASEGMSLVAMEDAGIMIAFGGYNGKYSHSVSLFRPKEESSSSQNHSATRSGAAGVAAAPDTERKTTDEAVTSSDGKVEALQAKLEVALKNAAVAKEAAASELSIMRKQLSSAHSLLQVKEKLLSEKQDKLTEAESKAFKLEAEVAELKNKLMKMGELEKELEVYRKQKKQISPGKTGGVWGWVAGE